MVHLSRHNLQLQRPEAQSGGYSGVTTMWLLSTLGGSRNANAIGVKKKDIVSVSIPETCKVLYQNRSEYSLRSASNLLYGVTVCYGRKTDYVLADVASVRTQLQRQLLGPIKRNSVLALQAAPPTTIFDGVNEYKNLFELQKQQSAQNQQKLRRSTLLADDPAFDINRSGDLSFLTGREQGINSSANIIHQRDMMDELQNGYSHENVPKLYQNDALGAQNSAGRRDLSGLDADLQLDFDDVMSEVEMGSAKSSETKNQSIDHSEDFDLSFDNEEIQFPEAMGLPDLDIQISSKDHHINPKKHRFSLEPEGDVPAKKVKASHCFAVVSKVRIDDKIGLPTEALRENSEHYCELMDTSSVKAQFKFTGSESTASNEWRSVIFGDKQPTFLNRSFQLLLLAPMEQYDPDLSTSSVDVVERGRQKMRSLPSSRSSSVLSAERGMRLLPSDLFKVGNDTGLNPLALPELDQIDENLESDEYSAEYHGDIMGMDLQLPPSSFGRSSSRTDGESRDHIDELKRMHSARISGNRAPNSFDDIDESSAPSGPSTSVGRDQIQTQVLDHQSRRLFDYILERASFVGKTTRSHPPYHKKLLFEDLIPSKVSDETGATSSEGARSVSKKIAANAFLSLLQLASKSYLDVDHFHKDALSKPLNGDDIIVCV